MLTQIQTVKHFIDSEDEVRIEAKEWLKEIGHDWLKRGLCEPKNREQY